MGEGLIFVILANAEFRSDATWPSNGCLDENKSAADWFNKKAPVLLAKGRGFGLRV
jgi:hypothetical protein